LFGNSPKERGANSDFAFNIGGTWKLSAPPNLLFAGGRDIVGDTHAMAYIGFAGPYEMSMAALLFAQ
jgi:hypothetical protein